MQPPPSEDEDIHYSQVPGRTVSRGHLIGCVLMNLAMTVVASGYIVAQGAKLLLVRMIAMVEMLGVQQMYNIASMAMAIIAVVRSAIAGHTRKRAETAHRKRPDKLGKEPGKDEEGGDTPKKSKRRSKTTRAYKLPELNMMLQGSGRKRERSSEGCVYDPPADSSPNCLFMCLLKIARITPTDYSAQHLREEVREVIERAHNTRASIAGHTIPHWAKQVGMPVETFVRRTADYPCRPGTTLDAIIAAHLIGAVVWMFHSDNSTHYKSHFARPSLAIQHRDEHFTVIHTPKERDEERGIIVENVESLMQPPPQRNQFAIPAPQFHKLTKCLHNNIHFTEQAAEYKARHLHLPGLSAHLRYIIAPLQHVQDMTSTSTQTAQLRLEGLHKPMQLPGWTRFARCYAEVDEGPCPATMEMIENKVYDILIEALVLCLQEILETHNEEVRTDHVPWLIGAECQALVVQHGDTFVWDRCGHLLMFPTTKGSMRTIPEYMEQADVPEIVVAEKVGHAVQADAPYALIIYPQQIQQMQKVFEMLFPNARVHLRRARPRDQTTAQEKAAPVDISDTLPAMVSGSGPKKRPAAAITEAVEIRESDNDEGSDTSHSPGLVGFDH
eukprot:995571-Amphidinium_carterae.1